MRHIIIEKIITKMCHTEPFPFAAFRIIPQLHSILSPRYIEHPHPLNKAPPANTFPPYAPPH